MPKLTIDGHEIEVENGTTVLQACEQLGIEVPVFCYHSRLAIAGNCRMCLVEMEKSPKPIASCAMPAGEGMVIKTNTPLVEKARKGNLEFLLINHPLDCPICDQGGECDLQDITMAYGGGGSRFQENKRAVAEKSFGPLIKTTMTRCIHCTRCVRFMEDVAGVVDIGAINRGEEMEITTYLGKAVDSELSGNVIDLCPVGALTSKPYAYRGRSWELKKTESIDVMDAVGSAVRVDSRGTEVMRILPRLNEDVNEEWISDKTRFACDGLKRQRLDRCYVRKKGKLQEATWDEALLTVARKLKTTAPEKIGAIAGDLCDGESMVALKDLMGSLGVSNLDCRQDGAFLDAQVRASYLFNTTIAGIDQADLCLLIGTNPRVEAPIINARLRKRYLTGELKMYLIGEKCDLTYPYDFCGNSPMPLKEILDGTHRFAKALKTAKRPMVIVGQGALRRSDAPALLDSLRQIMDKYNFIQPDWNGFNVLHTAAARVGGLDLGFVPQAGGLNAAQMTEGNLEVLYLLGADEIPLTNMPDTFVIYQGHHGDAGAHRADVIFPGAAYTEKSGVYVNTEGRVQHTELAIFPPGDAREDWKILRALSEKVGKNLPYDTLAGVRARLAAVNPVFGGPERTAAPWGKFGTKGKIQEMPFVNAIANFYQTDSISRVSETMAKCMAEHKNSCCGGTCKGAA